MASFNRVVLLGNLTRDPELRYTPGKKAVVDCGIAINERYKKDDQWVENTTFIDLTFWGRTAEVANEYLVKGSSALIEGKLRYESWEDKDGSKRSKVKVVVDQLTLLGKPKGETSAGTSEDSVEEPVTAGTSGSDNEF